MKCPLFSDLGKGLLRNGILGSLLLAAVFVSAAYPQAGTSLMEPINAGSLIIAMDNDKQGDGSGCNNSELFNLRAYGLAVRLLHSNIPLKWAINDSKGKDGADFVANASRITGSNCQNGGVNTSFSGGPLIITDEYRTAALAVINTFNGEIGGTGDDVRIYDVQAGFVAPIRYTLTHKPLIAIGPDAGGFGNGIHQTLFNNAKLRAANNQAYYANVNNENIGANSCYTIATQPHAASNATNYINQYKSFANNGGNLLFQCYSVDAFENHNAGLFHTTTGWTVYGTNDNTDVASGSFSYPNPSIPYAQFIGALANQDGAVTEFRIRNGGAERPGMQVAVTNTGATHGTKRVATVAHYGNASSGGHVFELGGHSYYRTNENTGNTEIGRMNGQRMILNAVLTPALRQGCNLSINSVQAFKSVAMSVDGNNNGQPNIGDTVEWTIRYINDGTVPVTNFQITDPLDNRLKYVVGSITATATAGSSAVANANYRGNANNAPDPVNINLLTSGSLAPNGMITVKIKTIVQGFGVIPNQGTGTGTGIPSPVLTDTTDDTTSGTVAGHPIACPGGNCLPQDAYQTTSPIDPTKIDLAAIPSAAPASVGGIVTDANGRGVARERLTLQNLSTGEILYATTNTFGRFLFPEVPTAEFYILSVDSKRLQYSPSNHTFTLLENLTSLSFTAQPPGATIGLRGASTAAPAAAVKSIR